MVKYCPECGAKVKEKAVVCVKCGISLKDLKESSEGREGERKSSGIAAVLSFFFPGLGQIYNGQIGKGILFIILSGILILLMFVLIGIPLYLIFWIYNIYDAYKTAEATWKRKS
jgi:TM2 domain-containing membrane protein YozV/ribosomal protein L40E